MKKALCGLLLASLFAACAFSTSATTSAAALAMSCASVETLTKPKPFSSLNHFTVPVAMLPPRLVCCVRGGC